jgi:hypothetical protein
MKAKKFLEEHKQFRIFEEIDQADVIIALLVDEFTSGRASQTKNPYARGAVVQALEYLAKKTGIKDKFDVDIKGIIGGK